MAKFVRREPKPLPSFPRRQPKPTSGRGDNRLRGPGESYSDVILRVAAEGG